MSRLRQLTHSLASGYATFAITVVYSLASVPLALHYLSKPEFALWALLASIAGYLSLVDLGMSSSIARLLIDHKDDKAGENYGGLVRTGWLVLVVQGLIVLALGWTLAPWISALLDLPPELRAEFTSLLRWQCGVLAIAFATRLFSHLLHAHQRLDLVNYSQAGGLVLGFFLLWYWFARGGGVFSFVWATLATTLAGNVFLAWMCARLQLFPADQGQSRIRWQSFCEMFNYGKDLFLVAVGTQLIMASQTIIITRVLGLEAAAAWAIGTKMFSFASQLLWRIYDFSAPAFAEMMVRGEHKRLAERYRGIVMVSAALAGVAAVTLILCNSLFVHFWTSGKISWLPGHDLLLGAWMIVLAVLHCHSCFVMTTKRVDFMRYVYFAEGLVYVGLALFTARWGGFTAVIACSILCSVALSGGYGVVRVSRYFGISLHVVALQWLGPLGRVLLRLLPLAVLFWWVALSLPPLARLGLHALFCAGVGGGLLLRYGLPPDLQAELLRRAPRPFTGVLKRLFPAPPR